MSIRKRATDRRSPQKDRASHALVVPDAVLSFGLTFLPRSLDSLADLPSVFLSFLVGHLFSHPLNLKGPLFVRSSTRNFPENPPRPLEGERRFSPVEASGSPLKMVSKLVPTVGVWERVAPGIFAPPLWSGFAGRRATRSVVPPSVRLLRGPTCPPTADPHDRSVSVPSQPGVSEDRPR
jgi:hypothetical protein